MIYLEEFEDKQPSSFREVLDVLYDRTKGVNSLVSTFVDKECITRECWSGRNRSFQALCEIARTYFPKMTADEVYQVLYEKGLHSFVCFDIERVVFHYHDVPIEQKRGDLANRLLRSFREDNGLFDSASEIIEEFLNVQ